MGRNRTTGAVLFLSDPVQSFRRSFVPGIGSWRGRGGKPGSFGPGGRRVWVGNQNTIQADRSGTVPFCGIAPAWGASRPVCAADAGRTVSLYYTAEGLLLRVPPGDCGRCYKRTGRSVECSVLVTVQFPGQRGNDRNPESRCRSGRIEFSPRSGWKPGNSRSASRRCFDGL